MKRDLIKQMKNEWRENIWLLLELLIVLLSVWALIIGTYMSVSAYLKPRGFSADNVYKMTVKHVNEESPLYVDFGEETAAKKGEDMLALITRIRKSPYVEAAAFSNNGLPYQYSYMGNGLKVNGDTIDFNGNWREVSPDMVRVLKYESLNGVSADRMEALLKKGELLLASSKEYDKIRDPRKLLGAALFLGNDSARMYTSHVLINNVRRSDFEESWGGSMICPINEEEIASGKYTNVWEIAVRLKPGTESKFLDEFRNDRSMQIHRNIYLGQPQSLMKIRDTAQRTDMMRLRMLTGGAVCLMIMVFIGLLGTFWYRIRHRESEIAIRKVNGATSGDIFRRLVSEGMLLVIFAMVLAVILAVVYLRTDLVPQTDTFVETTIISGFIALAIMLVVVVAGISIPARLAMRIEPAVALKDE